MKIGVLAVQGAFAEHIAALRKLDTEAEPVRLPEHLLHVDGLVIPGGESTTISKLLNAYNMMPVIRDLAAEGLPILGTCAGMILLARTILGDDTPSLGLMDIAVRRNAFGRQVDSFETNLDMAVLGDEPYPAVFIRAPYIESAGPGVDILATLVDGTIVAVRQDNLLATAFHPELTGDLRFHGYFLDIVRGSTRHGEEKVSAANDNR